MIIIKDVTIIAALFRKIGDYQVKLKSVIDAADFSQLINIAQDVTVVISCWGTRWIQSSNYEGKVSIDSLAKRMIDLVREKKFEFSSQERETGRTLAVKITGIYKTGDQKIERSNCLTQFFWKVYSSFNRPLGDPFPSHIISKTREQWGDLCMVSGFERVFSYYTPNQFQEKFGRPASFFEESQLFDERLTLAIGPDYRSRSRSNIRSSLAGVKTGKPIQSSPAVVDWDSLSLRK